MTSKSGQADSQDGAKDFGMTVRRSVAAVLDLIPVAALFLLLSAISGEFVKSESELSINLSGAWLYLFVVLAIEYFVVFEAKMGATLGKMFVGLRVVGFDGEKPSWSAALIRNVLRPVDLLPLAYGVGIISIILTGKRQRIGDLAAGTIVVEAS